jgi:hypothetical protein
MAGYSGTPLVQKLGIRPGDSIAWLNVPDEFEKELGPLPKGTKLVRSSAQAVNFVHFFTTERDELYKELPRLRKKIAQNGMIWVSWPKKASKVQTDVTEDIVRNIALKNGLVDVKVCAVNDIWSGLKLVIPLKDRKTQDRK